MKISSSVGGKSWMAIFLASVSCVCGSTAVRAEQDLNALFQAGRTAYYDGKYDLAKQLLTQVAVKNPNHFETRALLAQMKTRVASDGGYLQKTYSTVTIPKVQFEDVTLEEALQGLTVLSKNASGGKVVPNFIVKSPEAAAKRVTLSLNDVPLDQVIKYLSDLTGSKASYDKHAVIFNNQAG